MYKYLKHFISIILSLNILPLHFVINTSRKCKKKEKKVNCLSFYNDRILNEFKLNVQIEINRKRMNNLAYNQNLKLSYICCEI